MSNPIVADMDGDGTADIVAVTGDGVVAAVDRNGKMVRGFPLAAGVGNQSVAAFGIPGGKNRTCRRFIRRRNRECLDHGSGRRSWAHPWPQYQKDARHSGFDGSTLTPGAPVTQEFFPANRAYNWPNPVYDGITHIRYYVKENATVRVKIFDFAGDLVADLPAPVSAAWTTKWNGTWETSRAGSTSRASRRADREGRE